MIRILSPYKHIQYIIGGCNSGVANQALGCSTMADILMDCCLNSSSRNAYIVSVYRTLQVWLRSGIINRAQQTAIYNCAVRNYFNCGSYSGNGTDRSIDVSFDEPTDVFDVKIWPNPSDNYINVKINSGNDSEKVSIQVFDIRNQRVHSDVFTKDEKYEFGDNLQSGMYFVKIGQANNAKVLKVIKY